MPEVTRITLRASSVAEALSRIKQDFLPEEIAEDFLSRWVMDFDPLQKQANERDFRINEHDLNNRYSWTYQLYSYAASNILQAQMPFYFASLFHIGRQWQAATYSLQNIANIEQPNNLLASAEKLTALSEQSLQDLFLPREAALTLIRSMCGLGREQQTRKLDQARLWWHAWRSEVRLYRQAVNELQEYVNVRNEREQNPRNMLRPVMQILTYSMQGSSLKREMQHQGIQFKPDADTQTPSIFESKQQHWWILLALTLIGNDDRNIFDHRFFGDLDNLLRKQLLAPQVEIALERLKRKYGEEDPFTLYSVGKSAPTLELLDLIREHKLPDGSVSPWLSAWEETLESPPRTYNELPIVRGWEEIESLSVRSADSTIKQYLRWNGPLPADSWSGFLQRIFEKEWVEVVGRMAGNTNKKFPPSALPWTLKNFQVFITRIVIGLNRIGYSLTPPDIKRLSTLLDKAKNEKIWKDITW